jgi:hypothetical protein
MDNDWLILAAAAKISAALLGKYNAMGRIPLFTVETKYGLIRALRINNLKLCSEACLSNSFLDSKAQLSSIGQT